MDILGIDIGGSGIKGAVVDAETGELLTKRRRIATPEPSTPEAVCRGCIGNRPSLRMGGPDGLHVSGGDSQWNCVHGR